MTKKGLHEFTPDQGPTCSTAGEDARPCRWRGAPSCASGAKRTRAPREVLARQEGQEQRRPGVQHVVGDDARAGGEEVLGREEVLRSGRTPHKAAWPRGDGRCAHERPGATSDRSRMIQGQPQMAPLPHERGTYDRDDTTTRPAPAWRRAGLSPPTQPDGPLVPRGRSHSHPLRTAHTERECPHNPRTPKQ